MKTDRLGAWRPGWKMTMAAVASWALASSANGAIVITVGSHNLAAETDAQTVSINAVVDAGVNVGGIDFYVQVANRASGPKITAVDILTGTPFASNNTGVATISENWFAYRGTATSSLSTPLSVGSTLMATITLDTRGVAPGEYSLLVKAPSAPANTTKYLDDQGDPIGITITDGALIVAPVPEPEHWAAIAGGALLGFAALRRRMQG